MNWNDATVSRYRRLPASRALDLDFKELGACFVVRDRGGQALSYVYFEDEPGWRSGAPSLSVPARTFLYHEAIHGQETGQCWNQFPLRLHSAFCADRFRALRASTRIHVKIFVRKTAARMALSASGVYEQMRFSVSGKTRTG
jgi:hypothetical protein